MSGLHEHDALAWAEHQAALLRRLAGGERVNELVDWPNVIQEVQDVGLSELRSCRSLLRQALVHLLKLRRYPESPAAAHWRGEVIGFLADAQDRFFPSMRQRIGLDAIYRVALQQVATEAEGLVESSPAPEACPFSLDDLLTEHPDLAALVSKIAT